MSTQPIDALELRALKQRNELHQTATELKTELKARITETREKFQVARNAREHFVGATILVGALSLLSGYGVAGIFSGQ